MKRPTIQCGGGASSNLKRIQALNINFQRPVNEIILDAERQTIGDTEGVNNVPCIASPHSWRPVTSYQYLDNLRNAPISSALESYLTGSCKILDSYF